MEGFYTVAEFSKITGKDPGNIRRMLIYGKLLGEKMGNQWVIPKDAKYPSDQRVKSGEYKNWRKKKQISRDNPQLMKSLNKMCAELHGIFGNSMYEVVLYGSYARGEQSADSDVDIALILKDTTDEETHDKMVDIVVDYELDLAVTLSVVPIELNQYNEWKKDLPFYKNIDREGIILWKAA
jgi:predicted nucleotidyltransferase